MSNFLTQMIFTCLVNEKNECYKYVLILITLDAFANRVEVFWFYGNSRDDQIHDVQF